MGCLITAHLHAVGLSLEVLVALIPPLPLLITLC